MDVIEFVKGMVPGLKRMDVDEDLTIAIKELNKVVTPAYFDADGFFKATRLVSEEAKDAQVSFYDEFKPKGGKSSTFVGDIYKALPNLIENAEFIKKEVNRQFEPDLVAEGMTAKKAAVLRAAEYITFISRFSVDLLTYVYFFEAQKGMGAKAAESIEIAPATIKRVVAHLGRFSRLLAMYAKDASEFQRSISATPDVLVGGKNADIVSSVYPMEKLDMGFVQVGSGFIPNPIYHARMLVAEWQLSRYKQSEEKLASLKLRLLHLQMVNRNEQSPKLEVEIQYTQGRVDKLERKLNDMREEVGLPELGS